MVLVPLELVSRIGRKHFLIKHRDSSGRRSINNGFVFKVLLPWYMFLKYLVSCPWLLYFTVISRLPDQSDFISPESPRHKIHTPPTKASASKAYLFCHGNPCHFELEREWWCHYQERTGMQAENPVWAVALERIISRSQTIMIQREAISTRHLGFI